MNEDEDWADFKKRGEGPDTDKSCQPLSDEEESPRNNMND